MHTTLDGLVLRSTSGPDRILTILTAEQGVLTAFANKAGTMRSKLAASTEALAYSRFVLFQSRGRTVVDNADLNRIFFGLRESWDKLCLATYFAQLAAELCPHGEDAEHPLRLTLNTLHFLEKGTRDFRLLKALYELRLLTLTGFMPDLVGCAVCGVYEADSFHFFPDQGALVCGNCLTGHGQPGGVPLAVDVLAAMRHILYAQPEKLFSFTLDDAALDQLSRLSEQYLLAQVEKGFSALETLRQCNLHLAGSAQTLPHSEHHNIEET